MTNLATRRPTLDRELASRTPTGWPIPTCFALGLLMCAHLGFGGELYLVEALAPLILLVGARRLDRDPVTSKLLLLGGLWLVGQLLSDLINGVSFSGLMLGSAVIVFTLVDILLVRLAVGNDLYKLGAVFLGYGVASIVRFFLQPSALALAEPWKFGVGLGASFIIVALASRGGVRLQVIVVSALVVAHTVAGYRSQALILLLALLAVIQPRFRLHGVARFSAVAVLLAGLLGAQQAYSALALSGDLGNQARVKYVDQTQGSVGLLSARGENIYAALAILDRPLIGLGSEARDRNYIFARGVEIERRMGSELALARERDGMVPLHSHILGAWARSGILAVPFWLLAIAILARGLLALGALPARSRLLVAFGCLNTAWDVLFSPLGSFGRFQFALGVCAALVGLAQVHRDQESARRRPENVG